MNDEYIERCCNAVSQVSPLSYDSYAKSYLTQQMRMELYNNNIYYDILLFLTMTYKSLGLSEK